MHAENVLEFEALRALLGRYVRSALGARELAAIAPISDRPAIEAALADAAEAIEYLRTSSQPQPASRGAAIRVRFGEIADPAPAIARLAHRRRDAGAAGDFRSRRGCSTWRRRRDRFCWPRAKNFRGWASHASAHRRSARSGARSARQDSAGRNASPMTRASRWRGCAAKWSGSGG